jgi:hypothetical protein
MQRIYPFGIARNRLEQAIRDTGVPAIISDRIDDADMVVTLRNYYRRKPQSLRDAEARNVPIYVLKNNTVAQMEQALSALRGEGGAVRGGDPVMRAMEETEEAIGSLVTGERRQVDLEPQNAYIRRIQHQIAQKFNVGSRSHGREPYRRVRVFSDGDTSLPFED